MPRLKRKNPSKLDRYLEERVDFIINKIGQYTTVSQGILRKGVGTGYVIVTGRGVPIASIYDDAISRIEITPKSLVVSVPILRIYER